MLAPFTCASHQSKNPLGSNAAPSRSFIAAITSSSETEHGTP